MNNNIFQGRVIEVVSEYGAELGGMVLGQEIANNIKVDSASLLHSLAELKNRLGGDFRVLAEEVNGGVLIGQKCPFGDVRGKPALCQVTKQVFQQVSRKVSPFANITISKALAQGNQCCEISVSLCGAGRVHQPQLRVVGE